jgi:hypothetical protein
VQRDFRFICPDEELAANPLAPTPSLFSISRLVIFEAFLWGVGTAIGELPPYFVARAARLSNDKLKLQQNDDDDDNNENENNQKRNKITQVLSKLLDKGKDLIKNSLGRLGFIGIMLFASSTFSIQFISEK